MGGHFLAWACRSCLSALHLSGVLLTRLSKLSRSFSSWAQCTCMGLAELSQAWHAAACVILPHTTVLIRMVLALT